MGQLTKAALELTGAPPFLTVQDLGRFGYRTHGVAPAGAMDQVTLRTLNVLLDNSADAAALEWSVAGGTLRAKGELRISIGGAEVECFLSGVRVPEYTVVRAHDGDELKVERFLRGRFLYVAVAGGINVPVVLGSRSTYLPAELGGFDGRRLKRGDVVAVAADGRSGAVTAGVHGTGVGMASLHRTTPIAESADSVESVLSTSTVVRVMRGPQAALFSETDWTTFLSSTFSISLQSDRMGYRLEGPAFQHVARAELLSEPTCVGAIQVPAGTPPIVLMNDGPTVGGYPKIAVIVDDDLAMFAQREPGASVRFALV